MSAALKRRLFVLCGLSLIGLGAYALVHPEFSRGASLILLGFAILERGSAGTNRFCRRISSELEPKDRGGRYAGARRRRWYGGTRPAPVRWHGVLFV